MSDRIFVFVAWGARYLEELARCIELSALDGAEMMLVTDRETDTGSLPPNVRVIRHRFMLSAKERKAEALAILPDDLRLALFLDVDTRIVGDISLGFEKAARHGMAMAVAPHYSLADIRGFGDVMLREGARPMGQVAYNSGVIFFDHGNPAVRAVFAESFRLATLNRDVRWGDQAFLSLAAELLNFNPYTLSASFNCRAFGELISGSVRIWHSYQPMPPDAPALEQGYLHRYEDGRMVRALKVPI